MIFRILLYAFLIYLAYRLIFDFIIPVYKATRQVKSEFQNMQEKMQEHMRQQQPQQEAKEKNTSNAKEQVGEYIDFEELK